MATLVSPGTAVTVIDESFYTSSGPGTIPLILIATAQNKLSSSGTSIAAGTTSANAETLYLVSSQRDLLQTFGEPIFYSAAGSQLNGYSLNEYGLLAANSYLGIANAAYILRANIDLSQLYPSINAPAIDPVDGTFWMNISTTQPALYEWSGTKWAKQSVYKFPYELGVTMTASNNDITHAQPLNVPSSFKYCMVCGMSQDNNIVQNAAYVRNGNDWDMLLDASISSFQHASLADFQYGKVYPSVRFAGGALQVGDVWFNTNENDYDLKKFENAVERYVDIPVLVGINDADALAYYGGINNIKKGDVFAYSGDLLIANGTSPGIAAAIIVQWNGTVPTRLSDEIPNQVWSGTFEIRRLLPGAKVYSSVFNLTFSNNTLLEVVNAINADPGAAADGINAEWISATQWRLTSTKGYTLDVTGNLANNLGMQPGYFFRNPITSFDTFDYKASPTPPVQESADGTLWHSTEFKVDMLVNDGTGHWDEIATPIYVQPDAPSAPVANSYWVDTNDLENYPVIYKRNSGNTTWVLRDNTDQVTPSGVVFADARPNPTYGTDSGVNNGNVAGPDLDADRPDPLLYPSGMVLFNTRYSTRNVKKYKVGYEFEGVLVGDRWVSISGNKPDGSPYMGDEAVREVIAKAMRDALEGNTAIRSSDLFFNLITAPGFPELIQNMVSLNIDRAQTAFVIGDTPFTLASDANSLQKWCTNANNAITDGTDGLLTADANLAVYYPSGVSTNTDGTTVVVPPSHMVLRSYAYNDQVAYQWYAPAGLQRGVISNASSVGYVDAVTGEFVPVKLDEGQRDTLYTNNVNPIRQMQNKGAVIWGQKTRSPVQSAMDRVNVARLVNYIRYQADIISQPFIFQPNDETTWKQVRAAYNSFLSELVTLRGLTDYLVVVDKSNNTPSRIDANELWIDIAIIPTKAIEFIYIPIRIKNTGEI